MKIQRLNLNLSLVFLIAFVAISFAHAQSVPTSFVYQGQITKAGGVPLEANPVVFNVRIYSALNDCLMYEEQHSINMLGSEGIFSLNVGGGIRTGTDYEDTSSIVDIFRNGVNFTGITTCAAGTSYNALTGHTRKVRISYNDGGGLVTLAQDFHLQTVPYAWYANSLQGLTASNFVQINPGQNVTQTNLDNLLGGTNYNTLYNLASGTSTAPLSMNNQQIKNLSDPTLAQDAATKNYADTRVGGSLVNLSGVGAGTGDGRVLAWNATLSQWEAITPSSITDGTKLPLAGGTMGGNINMNGNQILNAGHVTLQNLSTVTLGKFTNAQETTLVGTLGIGNKGATWYNSTTDKIMYWDGNSAETVGAGAGAGDIEEVATAAGSGLTGGVASGAANLAVVVDGLTLEVNGSNQLQVRDAGLSLAKLAADSVNSSKVVDGSIVNADISAGAAIAWSKMDKTGAVPADIGAVGTSRSINTNSGSGLTGGGTLAADRSLAINTDNSTLEISTNTLQIKDGGVTNAKINSVSVAKISSAAAEYFSYMPAGTECTNGYTLVWDSTTDRWLCGALPSFVALVSDADNDTKIQVEESADEDKIRFDTAGTERMIIDETGRVGVGTTTPAYLFEARSANLSPNAEVVSGAFLGPGVKGILAGYATDGAGAIREARIRAAGSIPLSLGTTNSSNAIYVLDNGNVGVGVTNPTQKFTIGTNDGTAYTPLDLSNNAGLYLLNANAGGNYSGIRFRTSNNGADAAIGMVQTNTNQSDLVFITEPITERMRIQGATGNIGIGTANPQAKLDVAGTIRANEICDEAGSNCKDISSGWGAGGDIDGITTNAGSALSGGTASGTATLSVVTDAATIETNGSNQLQVKDGGLSLSKLAADSVNSSKIVDGSIVNSDINAAAAIAWSKIDKTGASAADVGAVPSARSINTNSGSGLTGGGDLTADRNIAINTDNTTLEISTNTLRIKDGGVTNAKINSVSVNKITSAAAEYFSYMPAGTECTNGYTLVWDSTTDRWLCGALPTFVSLLRDTDNDTKIQLEESADEDKIRFDTAGLERMIIDEAGNVGIGTSNPSAVVSGANNRFAVVNPGGGVDLSFSGNGYARQFFMDTSGGVDQKLYEILNYNGAFQISRLNDTNSVRTSRLYIDPAGNTGIGTSTPLAKLDVAGNIRAYEICDETGSNCKDISSGWAAGGDIDGITTSAGSALSGGTLSGTATLSVVTDATTIETNGSNQLQIKDAGVTLNKLAADSVNSSKVVDGSLMNADINASAAIAWSKIDKTGATAADVGAIASTRNINTNSGSGLTGGGDLSADRNLAINTDNSTLEIATNTLRVKDSGITNAKINSVSVAKVSSAASEYFSYMPAGTECSNGNTLIWEAVTDRWICGAAGGAGDGHSLDAADGSPTDRVFVDNAGNVAVGGTGTGDQVFAVSGGMYVDFLSQNAGSVDKAIRFGGNGSGQAIGSKQDAGGNQYGLDFYTGYTNRMAINSAGNVGIGTTSPDAKLSVNGSITAGPGSVSSPAYMFLPAATYGATGMYAPAANTLAFATTGGERLRVDSSGNVGIGTTVPTSKFEVNHAWSVGSPTGVRVNDGFIGAFANNNSPGYYMQAKLYKSRGTASAPTSVAVNDVLGAFSFAGYDASTYKHSASIASMVESGTSSIGNIPGNLVFQTTDSVGVLYNRMILNGAGNVGIGTMTPSEKLEVAGVIHSTTGGIKFPDGSVQLTSATSGTNNSMESGFPDVIQCNVTSPAIGRRTLYLNTVNYLGTNWYVEPLGDGSNYYTVRFNPDGSFSSASHYTTHDCSTSIAAVYAAGRGFNFVKGPAAQWLQSGSNAYYNSGNVGIGTTSPSFGLDVWADNGSGRIAGATASFTLNRAVGSGSAPDIYFQKSRGSNSSPTVVQNGDYLGHLGFGGYDGANFSTRPAGLFAIVNGTVAAGSIPTDLAFGAGSAGSHISNERMRITSAGNVGIGTASPQELLEINKSSNPVMTIHDTSTSSYKIGIDETDAGVFKIAAMDNGFGGHGGSFTANDSQVISMTQSGNVGIGTTSSSTRLTVQNAGNNVIGGIPGGWGGGIHTFDLYVNGSVGAGTNGNLSAWMNSSGGAYFAGNVGIGTASPGDKLEVRGTSTGTIRVSGTASNNYAGVEYFEGASRRWSTYLAELTDEFYILDADHTNGVYLQQNNSSWLAYSDVRLKENIHDYSVLDKIDKYRAVSYDWKANKTPDVGVIAQEIVRSFPEVVDVGDEDLNKTVKVGEEGVWGVKYDKLAALAMQGVKEVYEMLKGLVADMEEKDLRIQNLENENAQLKSYLCQKDPNAPFCKSVQRSPAQH